MKKSFAFIYLILLIVTGCGLETKTIPEFYKGNLDQITKVVIVDGSTGYKKTLTDPLVIKEFIDKIKDIKFIPEKKQEDREGWRYSVTLFQDDEEAYQFGLTQVNENYYYTNPDIHPIVDDFYKSLNIQEE
ncbi:hypothetical protein J2Z40_003870 [Cytobacillus eiseniae]|uniref:Lipoprotein n=1 Tax=Cytobacillus eiseniae TaxID=762947 RepID=A0ABS4RK44_9BACI|nr:hypothetical protein [Cytobacillus eiseniae]MBP2243271.1 hypothetical protein [Cytobacillus eiseniae]